MNIFITGGLGFVGCHLSSALLKDSHQITAVGCSKKPDAMIKHPAFKYLIADTTKPGDWQETVADHDIVINLTGKSIFTLWTQKVKKEIFIHPTNEHGWIRLAKFRFVAWSFAREYMKKNYNLQRIAC